MKHTLRKIIGLAASAAFIFPLTIHPQAMENCADSSFHFVTSDAFGTTIEDTSNAKQSYCKVVDKNAQLWELN